VSILDNMAEQGENDWLSDKLDESDQDDPALQTTARVMTAHIWPFLAAAISDDDYRARRGVKEQEVRYMCATVAPHVASSLTDFVLAGFDRDYTILRHQGQEELAMLPELGDLLSGLGGGGGGDDDDEPGPADTPKVSARRRLAQGDPYSATTLLPTVGQDDDNSANDGQVSTTDVADDKPEPQHHMEQRGPGMAEAPKVDGQWEPGSGYYSQWGAGGQQLLSAARRMDRPALVKHLKEHHGELEPKGYYGPLLDAHQKAHQEGADHGHMSYGAENHFEGPMVQREASLQLRVDRYGHISLGARWYPYGHPEAEDPDPDGEMAEAESRSPDQDVHFEHDEPHYEADWDREFGNWLGGAHDRNPKTSAETKKDEKKKEHKHGEGKEDDDEDEEEKHQRKIPGKPWEGRSKAKPSAGRQTHKSPPHRPAKEGQLARGPQRPPGAPRRAVRPEMGYDPSEAFPGYYGTSEPPRRRRTAQAPLTGNSDVPQDPESDTGASGQFNPGGALQVAGPGGTTDTDFSQQDAPQDIQDQLGQMPTLSHKIGAKLAEMATEVLVNNPRLSALGAMEVALKALRLYPKVASGGADYLAEPGTEGVPTEVLEDCPQCQRQAYNPNINRCHFCGFFDAGLEAAIEVT
jgi:hypothetical protein